jgi:hypothetical protein
MMSGSRAIGKFSHISPWRDMLRHVREHKKKMNPTERQNRTAPARSFALLHFHPHALRLRRSGALHKHPGGTRSVVSESIKKKMIPTERPNRTAPAKSCAPLHFHPHAPRLRQSGALHKTPWRDTLRRIREHKKKMNPTERKTRLAPARSFAPLHFPPHAPRLRRSGALQKRPGGTCSVMPASMKRK